MRKNQKNTSKQNLTQENAAKPNIFEPNTSEQNPIKENASKADTFQEATGKIDYTLTNDYIFRAVLERNENVLRGLICSLLRLNARDIKSVTILNPVELGEYYEDKDFVLDVKVMLNKKKIINIEMQVGEQNCWNNRSLSYLCAIFDNLEKGADYSKIKPSYHIGILNFTPFPKHPEFYATNKIMNIKKHYIYNDNFTLNVLDLTQIHLANEEDKAYNLDYWAKLFKASTWEDFNMLAKKDKVFGEMGEAVFKLNQDKRARYICEMREAGRRTTLTYTNEIARLKKSDQRKTKALAKKDVIIAEKDSALAEKDSVIASLKAQLEALQQNK